MLGEVVHILTPEQVAADQLVPDHKVENLGLRVRECVNAG